MCALDHGIPGSARHVVLRRGPNPPGDSAWRSLPEALGWASALLRRHQGSPCPREPRRKAAPGSRKARSQPRAARTTAPGSGASAALAAVAHPSQDAHVVNLVFGERGYWASEQNHRQSAREKNIVKKICSFSSLMGAVHLLFGCFSSEDNRNVNSPPGNEALQFPINFSCGKGAD